MAVKGAILKQEIMNKLLEIFPDSFLYNGGKELRINGEEAGEPMQIKVTLTKATVAVDKDGGEVTLKPKEMPSAFDSVETDSTVDLPWGEVKTPEAPSEDEQKRVAELLANLGL